MSNGKFKSARAQPIIHYSLFIFHSGLALSASLSLWRCKGTTFPLRFTNVCAIIIDLFLFFSFSFIYMCDDTIRKWKWPFWPWPLWPHFGEPSCSKYRVPSFRFQVPDSSSKCPSVKNPFISRINKGDFSVLAYNFREKWLTLQRKYVNLGLLWQHCKAVLINDGMPQGERLVWQIEIR